MKEMTQNLLNEIKDFAEENFGKETSDGAIYADDDEFAVTNPWYDSSGRFTLTDEEAVKEWGLATVIQFCDRVRKHKEQN